MLSNFNSRYRQEAPKALRYSTLTKILWPHTTLKRRPIREYPRPILKRPFVQYTTTNRAFSEWIPWRRAFLNPSNSRLIPLILMPTALRRCGRTRILDRATKKQATSQIAQTRMAMKAILSNCTSGSVIRSTPADSLMLHAKLTATSYGALITPRTTSAMS